MSAVAGLAAGLGHRSLSQPMSATVFAEGVRFDVFLVSVAWSVLSYCLRLPGASRRQARGRERENAVVTRSCIPGTDG